jgi:hypothetical protein
MKPLYSMLALGLRLLEASHLEVEANLKQNEIKHASLCVSSVVTWG